MKLGLLSVLLRLLFPPFTFVCISFLAPTGFISSLLQLAWELGLKGLLVGFSSSSLVFRRSFLVLHSRKLYSNTKVSF
jgi:hypothetical protein